MDWRNTVFCSLSSDLGLHCQPSTPQKRDSGLTWVYRDMKTKLGAVFDL